MARNEYILSLAAANAHMTRYFCKELQEIMSVSHAYENKLLSLHVAHDRYSPQTMVPSQGAEELNLTFAFNST